MSLTSQLKDKNSPVRKFFAEFENRDGARECLALLQSTAPLHIPPAIPPTSSYTVRGVTMDYLIRYAAAGNNLDFENTIAGRSFQSTNITEKDIGDSSVNRILIDYVSTDRHLKNLFEIGKKYLDGRDAADYEAIRAATALSVIDSACRSGFLPLSFDFLLDEFGAIKKQVIREETSEMTTGVVLDEYLKSLGGDQYMQDISNLMLLFAKSRNDASGEFFDAKLVIGNQVPGNSMLVNGADFDCIIESKGSYILTDIKTTINPLKIEHLRQIIAYAFLCDEEKDGFKFSNIGIYHARSGSFRHLSLDIVIKTAMVGLGSVDEARLTFTSFLEKIKKDTADALARLAMKRKKARAKRQAKALADELSGEAERKRNARVIAKKKATAKTERTAARAAIAWAKGEPARLEHDAAREKIRFERETARLERETASIARENAKRAAVRARKERVRTSKIDVDLQSVYRVSAE